MTQQEYNIELNLLTSKFQKEKKEIDKKFAIANNPYKIGDFITDHVATIKVEEISFWKSLNGIPSCVYTGTQYNKDGSISKKQDHDTIFQMNIIKK